MSQVSKTIIAKKHASIKIGDKFKATSVEDVELIYTILRERFPENQIDVEYNYNTKEYIMNVTDKKYTEDPDIPLNLTIKVIYGDSVTGDTPILLRDSTTKQIYIKAIQDICNDYDFVSYPEFKMFDQTVRLEKLYSKVNLEVWSDKGWNPIKKLIKHKTNKKIYSILTNTGYVDVTEDHSLCTQELVKVKPCEVQIGTQLLHSFPDHFVQDFIDKYKNTVDGYDYFMKSGVIKSLASSKLQAMINYYIFKHLNNGIVYIECIDKERFLLSNSIIEGSNNSIKKIFETREVNIEEFVYDIETDLGRFQAGVGELIVFNTDSIFISVKFNRKEFELNRKDSFKLAMQCGDNITDIMFKRPPIVLEFEKVYQPFILLTKKRYIGKKFEDTRDPMKLKTLTTSGIAITRRDYCYLVKKCYKEVIDCIMDGSCLEDSVEIFKKYIIKIENYQVDFKDLIVSSTLAKNYSCSTCKEKCEWSKIMCEKPGCKENNVVKRSEHCPKCKTKFKCLHTFNLGPVNLAVSMLKRNEEINVNDRIQYLLVEKEGCDSSKKAELAEDPEYAKQHNMKFNRICYLEQLAKPLLGWFKVVLKEEPDLLNETITFVNEKLTEFGGKKLKVSDYQIDEDS
jgi:hypothetical protein